LFATEQIAGIDALVFNTAAQEVTINSNDETIPIRIDTDDNHNQDICFGNEKQEVVVKSTVKQFRIYSLRLVNSVLGNRMLSNRRIF
jgi:precorrin-2 methylase